VEINSISTDRILHASQSIFPLTMLPKSQLQTFLFHLLSQYCAANCIYGTADFPREAKIPVPTFGYDGLTGPLNWYGLNKATNFLCNLGTNQSPIVLNGSIATVPGSILNLTVKDYPNGAEFENLGTTLEVIAEGNLTYSGKTFPLSQFHFHTPSEHYIDREFYPMEWHWVFQTPSGRLICTH
jgi:carbonic anhydrase